MSMKKLFKQTKESKDLRLEIIVGLWTGVVIIILLGVIVVGSLLYVKKYQSDEKTKVAATQTPAPKESKKPKETSTPKPTKSPEASKKPSSSPKASAKPSKSTKPATVMYANGNINIRQSASADSKAMGTLKKGQAVTVVEKMSNGWSKVNANGSTGYIRSDLLSTEPLYDSYSNTPTKKPAATASTKPKATKKPSKQDSDVVVVVDEEDEEEEQTDTEAPTVKPSVSPAQTGEDSDVKH